MGMRVSLALFFFLRSCACAGQGEKKKPKNFGQVPGRADRNCREGRSHFSSFFFFGAAVWTWNRCLPIWQKMWRERDRDCWLQSIDGNEGLAGLFFALLHIFFTLFPSFSFFFLFFLFFSLFLFFCTLSHLFHFFHIISFFSTFFPFFFRILFRTFADLAAAALPPYLAFPYLASHYLSSPLLP